MDVLVTAPKGGTFWGQHSTIEHTLFTSRAIKHGYIGLTLPCVEQNHVLEVAIASGRQFWLATITFGM